jgi:hypothetical protein
MISCLSPLSASPGAITVPGDSTLSFVAIVRPDLNDPDPEEALADVTYTIVDNASRVCFANGKKTASIQVRVTAGGTEVPFPARFTCCGDGTRPPIITIAAEVKEGGAPRCANLRIHLQVARYHCEAVADEGDLAGLVMEDPEPGIRLDEEDFDHER